MKQAKNEKGYSTQYLSDYFRNGERESPFEQEVDKRRWVKEMCDMCLTGILFPKRYLGKILLMEDGQKFQVIRHLEINICHRTQK